MAKRPWEKPAQPTREFESFGHLPFAPKPKKTLECPKCGKVGEVTNKRSSEGTIIYRCNACKIEYSQALKKAYCTFKVTEKNGHWLNDKKTKEALFVRSIIPSDCRACPMYKVHFAIGKKCPHFKGRIGKELEPAEQWDKA